MSFHQFAVGALFGNFAVTQYDDLVGVLHGRKPVGDDHHRAAVEKPFHVLRDDSLVLGIERTGGLVEHHVLRLLVNGAGYHQPLLLSSADARAVATHLRFHAERQAVDVFLQA